MKRLVAIGVIWAACAVSWGASSGLCVPWWRCDCPPWAGRMGPAPTSTYPCRLTPLKP
jgi:hypothetical protein